MSLGLDQLSSGKAQAHGQECFPWQGDSCDAASWNVTLRGKGGGEGKMEKGGWPQWEEAINILVVTYSCLGFVLCCK